MIRFNDTGWFSYVRRATVSRYLISRAQSVAAECIRSQSMATTLQENVDEAGKIDEILHRQLAGAGADAGQKGAEVGRELAMVAEMGGILPDQDRVCLGTALSLVPMGDEADDFAANFRFSHGAEHILGGHRADDTKNPPPLQ